MPLGQQQLKLETLRRLQLAEEGEVNALPDPGNMTAYRNQAGKTLYFRVVGRRKEAAMASCGHRHVHA